MRSTVCLAGTVIIDEHEEEETKKRACRRGGLCNPHSRHGADLRRLRNGSPATFLKQQQRARQLWQHDGVNLRVGINDYEHSEIEPERSPRCLKTRHLRQGWSLFTPLRAKHVWGLQFTEREFSVSGEEASCRRSTQKISVCSGSANRSLTTFPLKWG